MFLQKYLWHTFPLSYSHYCIGTCSAFMFLICFSKHLFSRVCSRFSSIWLKILRCTCPTSQQNLTNSRNLTIFQANHEIYQQFTTKLGRKPLKATSSNSAYLNQFKLFEAILKTKSWGECINNRWHVYLSSCESLNIILK